ncbi:MAG TPA: peptidylprolyl isomerase [Pseudonocardiaceae bacterium]|nr:peptidylprolyl isomerase [Pseudonocardiaceae bacterium]
MPTNWQRREAAKRKLERQLARRAARAKRRRTYAVVGSAAAVVLVVGLIALVSFVSGRKDSGATAEPEPSALPLPTTTLAPPPVRPEPLPATVTCQYASSPPPAKPVTPPPGGAVPAQGTQRAILQTSAGPIGLTLERALAPCTVHSFLSLAKQGFYSGSPCHRLVTNPGLQVLQCGDPTGKGTGGPGYTIPDEVFPELTYSRGYVAMANTGKPNSGGSQFFLIFGDAQLLPSYTVFATISPEGLKVIDQIAQAGDDRSFEPSPGGGKPNKPVTIQAVQVG